MSEPFGFSSLRLANRSLRTFDLMDGSP